MTTRRYSHFPVLAARVSTTWLGSTVTVGKKTRETQSMYHFVAASSTPHLFFYACGPLCCCFSHTPPHPPSIHSKATLPYTPTPPFFFPPLDPFPPFLDHHHTPKEEEEERTKKWWAVSITTNRQVQPSVAKRLAIHSIHNQQAPPTLSSALSLSYTWYGSIGKKERKTKAGGGYLGECPRPVQTHFENTSWIPYRGVRNFSLCVDGWVYMVFKIILDSFFSLFSSSKVTIIWGTVGLIKLFYFMFFFLKKKKKRRRKKDEIYLWLESSLRWKYLREGFNQ